MLDRRKFCKVLAVGSAAAALPAAHATVNQTDPSDRTKVRDFCKLKYGMFVHYVWAGTHSLTVNKYGKKPSSLNELAAAFDVLKFANDIAEWGLEYVIFTAWHAGINPLYPSRVMKKWGLDSHYCERNLIGEIICALTQRGVGVLLYTHPRDGHDLSLEDQRKTGWNGTEGTSPRWDVFDFQRWNDFTNDLYGELVDHFGNGILGLYLDEGSALGDSWRVVDYQRLRKTIMHKHSSLVMIQNYYGSLYSCDIGDLEYHHWREFESSDGRMWPASKKPVGTCFATTWWADKPQGPSSVVFTAEDMFRYTILQAGTNSDGGGVQWAAGPYAGGGWESGVEETMRMLATYIKPIAKSVKGVVASRAFPTRDGMTLGSTAKEAPVVEWGVATDAVDGTATYLHILKPPSGRRLRIGMPADGSRFSKAFLVDNGREIEIDFGHSGYEIVLPVGTRFGELNTAICLSRDLGST